jgi:hypothetical protein
MAGRYIGRCLLIAPLLSALCPLFLASAEAQTSRQRMVVGTGVVCREHPNRTVRAVYATAPPQLLERIRVSLGPVTAPGKQQLLEYLADAEKSCSR